MINLEHFPPSPILNPVNSNDTINTINTINSVDTINTINSVDTANLINSVGLGDGIKLGTTIIGMKFEDGVVLVADGRTSSGQIVANRVARKITRILPNIFMLRSGSAADSQTLSTIIRYHAQSLKQQLKPAGRFPTSTRDEMDIDELSEFSGFKTNEYKLSPLENTPLVRSLARATHNLVHEYRNMLYCGVILAGVDSLGAQIFNVTVGGTLIEIEDFLATGSGSSFITAFLQSNYKKNLSQDECLKLLKKSIEYAILNDNSSGGIMRAVVVTKHKVTEYYFTQPH